jgi:hypothetical protein
LKVWAPHIARREAESRGETQHMGRALEQGQGRECQRNREGRGGVGVEGA